MYTITTDDTVTIITDDGYEVAHWTEDEWVEDPSLVPNIAFAVSLIERDPRGLIDRLYGVDGEWERQIEEREPEYPSRVGVNL